MSAISLTTLSLCSIEDRHATFAQMLDLVRQFQRLRWIHACRRLVEQKKHGLRHQRTRDLQPPPVGVRQRECEVLETRHQPIAENAQYFECAGARRRFFALNARKAQDRSDGAR